MSERPILFSQEMLGAILDGRKTVTRRPVRPQPAARLAYAFAGSRGIPGTWGYPDRKAFERWGEEYRQPDVLPDRERRWKPPCLADDLLWVRETWNYGYIESSDREYDNDTWFEPSDRKTEGSYLRALSEYWYKADAEDEKMMRELHGFWRPSIHMPREAARIWLKVNQVRVERLQQITDEAAMREGVRLADGGGGKEPREMFRTLWDGIYEGPLGWEANPWVWVIEFEMAIGGKKCG